MLGRSKALAVGLALLGTAALAPLGLAALTGSGQVSDVVQISTSTASVPASALTTSGTPAASGTAWTMTNSNSNVDTFVYYGWSTTPYYGSSSSATSMALRGTTYYINDLLWFKQEIVDGASTTTTSQYFSPLLIKNVASVSRVTWSSAGNACTGWTGSAAGGFSAAAAGSFTFKYHLASSQTDDTPSTSDTFYYCLDTTNSQVYLGTATIYSGAGAASLVQLYSSNSALATLKTYQYQLLNTGQTAGNKYCLTSYTGSGTSATPDLAQCQMMPYSLLGSATAKLYPLFDPPTGFPSGNQGGVSAQITYALSGTQWNPYSSSTTNSA